MYFQASNGDVPFLQPEEERRLFHVLRTSSHATERRAAEEQILAGHVKFVADLAHQRCRPYRLSPAEIDEAIAEGMNKLAEAMKKYEPHHESGAQLLTYAKSRIIRAIHRYILKHADAFKGMRYTVLPGIYAEGGASKTGLALRPLMHQIWKDHPQWSAEDVLDELGRLHRLNPDQLKQLKAMHRSMAPQRSAQEAIKSGTNLTYLDVHADDALSADEQMVAAETDLARQRVMREAFNALNARERDIYASRRLHQKGRKPTRDALGAKYGVSRERVRQIEIAADEKFTRRALILSARNGLLSRDYVRSRLELLDAQIAKRQAKMAVFAHKKPRGSWITKKNNTLAAIAAASKLMAPALSAP